MIEARIAEISRIALARLTVVDTPKRSGNRVSIGYAR